MPGAARIAVHSGSAARARPRAGRLSSTGMVPLAHVGHWLVDVLYLAPLLVLVIALAVNKLRERRGAG